MNNDKVIERFIDSINDDTINCDVIKNIRSDKTFSKDYFNVCNAVLNIALNAKKFKNDENTISGFFYDADIDIAVDKVKSFLNDYKIDNEETFLEDVKQHYPLIWIPNDDRIKATFVKNENHQGQNVGFFGVYYNLTEIPDSIWDGFVSKIK